MQLEKELPIRHTREDEMVLCKASSSFLTESARLFSLEKVGGKANWRNDFFLSSFQLQILIFISAPSSFFGIASFSPVVEIIL